MPPKKDTSAAGEALLVGFTDKETKLIAAASVSSIGPDKYDWDIMATLTGNTVGSLKKMYPPVKKKVIETYPSFGTFIGAPGAPAASAGGEAKPATAPKATKGKRKAADESAEDDVDADTKKDAAPTSANAKYESKSDGDKPEVKAKKAKKAPAEKKAPAKSRAKKVKKEETASDEETKVNSAEDSADGGDGLAAPEVEDDV